MTVVDVFLVDGRLRPSWRFGLSIPAVLLAMLVAERAASFVYSGVDHRQRAIAVHLFLLLALLAVCKLLTGLLDQKPLRSVGLAFCGRWHLELGTGLGLGALMIFSVAALERLLGAADFSLNSASAGQFLGWGVGLVFFLLLAATNEELIFRGYPFQRLAESVGAVGGVAVFSGLFGLVHLGNPNHTWISTLNTALVGVPLAVGYLRTRALWLPIGMHFAWNFVQGYGLGLPVSGLPPPFSLLRAEVRGSDLLTGGFYGPEGSLLTTGVILGATVYLFLSERIYISKEMEALVFGPGSPGGRLAATALSLTIPAEATRDDRPRTN